MKIMKEVIERSGAKLVIDHTTGLMWQQGGSSAAMDFAAAQEHVRGLNLERYAGYSDWRLPTLEEGMSLMEPMREIDATGDNPIEDLYIDPVFDKTQKWIWSADQEAPGVAWFVDFHRCYYDSYYDHFPNYVRSVRINMNVDTADDEEMYLHKVMHDLYLGIAEEKYMKSCQFLYDLRALTGFISGQDLHEIFWKTVGEPSPSGKKPFPTEDCFYAHALEQLGPNFLQTVKEYMGW